MSTSDPLQPARTVAARYAALPGVVALALAGSRMTGAADAQSDFDLYVFSQADLPLASRASVAYSFNPRAEVGGDHWGPGDEWADPESGLGMDAVYWTTGFMEDALERVLARHQASTGYSTCFLHSVRHCQPLHDPSGWLAALKARAAAPYPEELRGAIVRHNHPILRGTRSSYRRQIEKAVAREDPVSVNHRLAAFLASYFDIVFAVNRVPHPGEKRLLALAERDCQHLPRGMRADVTRLLGAGPGEVLAALDELSDDLDELLAAEGLLT